jgi:hypothetical protein
MHAGTVSSGGVYDSSLFSQKSLLVLRDVLGIFALYPYKRRQ